ncbi:MAG: acyl carrier protein [Leeuwenhoekiella sp.]
MNEEIFGKLKTIIATYLPEDVSIKDVEMESHLTEDLNINSTHLVDIVLDIEDEFDITIADDELDKMQTVQKSLDLINEKIETR